MKLNWGHKLVIFGVSFMLFVSGMVYFMTQQKIELVDENYYEKGIRYQDELNKLSAVQGKDIEFTYATAAAEIQFKLVQPLTTVQVNLYRPSDAALDQHITVTTDTAGYGKVSTAALTKGLWEVKMEWPDAGRTLTYTKPITVQ